MLSGLPKRNGTNRSNITSEHSSLRCLPIGEKNQTRSIITTWTIVLVKWTDLHLSTPKRPRSRNCRLHGLPSVVGLFLSQILEVTFTLCFSGFYLPSSVNINLSLKGVTEVSVANDQRGGLRFSSLFSVDCLVHSFFDAMGQGGEAMTLEQDYGVA